MPDAVPSRRVSSALIGDFRPEPFGGPAEPGASPAVLSDSGNASPATAAPHTPACPWTASRGPGAPVTATLTGLPTAHGFASQPVV